MNTEVMVASDARAVPELLPARMLNEYAYCPRLFYLEWVQREFVDSADTVDGRFKHSRVDQATSKTTAAVRASGDDMAEEQIHARSLELGAAELGAIARIDLLEGTGRRATPVDYKRGKVPGIPERAWPSDRVQLCFQGLILRENGYECEEGVAYYIGSRERVEVPFDEELIAQTRALLVEARTAAATPILPPPLVDSPKCPRCSLVGICLPDEVNALAHAPHAPGIAAPPVRRLMPARDDALPAYVTEQGAMVGKSGETLEIRRDREVLQTVRLIDISQLCLYGNILISAPTIYALTARGIPICHFSYGGWFHSITHGMSSQNILLRQRQFAACADTLTALAVARLMIQGKIKNCRTMLRRNAPAIASPVLDELARLADAATLAPGLDSLLGIEGAAARLYFGNLALMIKGTAEDSLGTFDWHGRSRRPPTDPINALLSFVYALLVKDLTIATLAVGFDPFMGVYHQPHFGRASLALDLAEEFRPLIGDSVVLGLINTRELQPGDFLTRAGATMLTAAGRKRTIAAYERRMEQTIRHPLFAYTISYRRILAVQARLLARHLLGEIPAYPPFRTR